MASTTKGPLYRTNLVYVLYTNTLDVCTEYKQFKLSGCTNKLSVYVSCYVDYFIFITFITKLKIRHHLFHLSFTTTNSDIAMQEHVIHELSSMASLSLSSRSPVDRAPARCSGGHWFDSRRGLGLFLRPTTGRPSSVISIISSMYHLQTNNVYCGSLVGCRMRNLTNI